MQPEISLLAVICLIGAAQGVFLMTALWDKKIANHDANRYLVAFLMVFTLALIDEFFYQSRYFYLFPYLVGLSWPTEFLYAPFFYFYILSLTVTPVVIRKKQLWHFLPFVIGFALAMPTWMLTPDEKFELLYGDLVPTAGQTYWAVVCDIAAILIFSFQTAIYLFLCFRQLYVFRRRLRQQCSSIEKINLTWLERLLWLVVFIWGVYIIDMYISDALGIAGFTEDVLFVSMTVTIYAMGYMGLRQPLVFKCVDLGEESGLETKGRPDKYKKARLPDTVLHDVKQRLLKVMTDQRPYLECELTLPQLAELVGCTTNHLSQVINEGVQKTFFDFVNFYRVEEVKRQLVDPEKTKLSILTLAMDAGFNSKSAFYSAFKKEVGVTPGQFRKSLKSP